MADYQRARDKEEDTSVTSLVEAAPRIKVSFDQDSHQGHKLYGQQSYEGIWQLATSSKMLIFGVHIINLVCPNKSCTFC